MIKNIITIFLMVVFLAVSVIALTSNQINGQEQNQVILFIRQNPIQILVALSFLLIPLFLLASVNKNNTINKVNLFKLEYWKGSARELMDLRKLIFTSLMLTLMVVSRQFALPTGFGALQLRWSFIPWIMAAIVVGPVPSMIIAVFYDVLGFFLFTSSGNFLITFTILSVARGLVFGVFVYKVKISLFKIISLFFVINIVINTVLGGINNSVFWLGHETFEQIRNQILFISLPSNLITFVPRILIMYLVIKVMLPIYQYSGLIDQELDITVPIFTRREVVAC